MTENQRNRMALSERMRSVFCLYFECAGVDKPVANDYNRNKQCKKGGAPDEIKPFLLLL